MERTTKSMAGFQSSSSSPHKPGMHRWGVQILPTLISLMLCHVHVTLAGRGPSCQPPECCPQLPGPRTRPHRHQQLYEAAD